MVRTLIQEQHLGWRVAGPATATVLANPRHGGSCTHFNSSASYISQHAGPNESGVFDMTPIDT